jgi:hypothetical protein
MLICLPVAQLCPKAPNPNRSGLHSFPEKTVDLDTIDKAIHDAWIKLTTARTMNSHFANHREQLLNNLLDRRIEATMTAPTEWPTEIDGDDTDDDTE